jgi:hypothetical protein
MASTPAAASSIFGSGLKAKYLKKGQRQDKTTTQQDRAGQYKTRLD